MTRERLIAKSYENGFNTAIDRVLEIIDDECRDDETGKFIVRHGVLINAQKLREAVLALKGGKE